MNSHSSHGLAISALHSVILIIKNSSTIDPTTTFRHASLSLDEIHNLRNANIRFTLVLQWYGSNTDHRQDYVLDTRSVDRWYRDNSSHALFSSIPCLFDVIVNSSPMYNIVNVIQSTVPAIADVKIYNPITKRQCNRDNSDIKYLSSFYEWNSEGTPSPKSVEVTDEHVQIKDRYNNLAWVIPPSKGRLRELIDKCRV